MPKRNGKERLVQDQRLAKTLPYFGHSKGKSILLLSWLIALFCLEWIFPFKLDRLVFVSAVLLCSLPMNLKGIKRLKGREETRQFYRAWHFPVWCTFRPIRLLSVDFNSSHWCPLLLLILLIKSLSSIVCWTVSVESVFGTFRYKYLCYRVRMVRLMDMRMMMTRKRTTRWARIWRMTLWTVPFPGFQAST